MAGFVDTLRGDGLARAQRALASLEGDPQRFDRARTRFDDSPPPYTSDRSGTTTRSASPILTSEERRMQLAGERAASRPDNQLADQIRDEEKRVDKADLNRTRRIPVGSDARTIAEAIVKKRWVEQGIWNSKWNQFARGWWKHEEPLEIESESETDTEAESPPPTFCIFGFPQKSSQPKPRRPKSDDEKRRIAERRVVREREREASRPYHQFVYQISTERERIQEESRSGGEGADTDTDTADINTRAYKNVQNRWTKRGMWNKRWGILPGMSWKHEEPREDEGVDDPMPVSVSETATINAQLPVCDWLGPFEPEPDHLQGPRDEDHEAGKAPFARDPPLFGSGPHPPLFGPRPPVEPNHPHGSRGPKPLLQRTRGKYGGFYDGDLGEEMKANTVSAADFFYKRIRPNIGDDRPSEDGPNLADADADADAGEEPLEETADGPASVNGNHGARGAPTRRIFGSPSPVESNHRQASGALDSSQQGSSADIDSAGLENSDAERSPSTPNSLRLRTGKRVLRPTTGQASRPSKRNPSRKDGQLASASLGPVHSSKVSKAAVKKKPGPQRRLNISQKVSSAGLPLSNDVDEAKPPSSLPDRAAPRRSKRIQPPVPTVSEDPTRTASTNPSRRAVRSRPERNVASSLTARSSARPQGISKKQPAKITRGRARKN